MLSYFLKVIVPVYDHWLLMGVEGDLILQPLNGQN